MEGSSKNGDNMLLQNYKLGRRLGFGASATVNLAEHVLTGLKVAIKIINKAQMRNMNMEQKVRREMKIGRLLVHPHVVRQYEVIETFTHIFIVMEYAEFGDLFEYVTLYKQNRFNEDEARSVFQQIIFGVEYIHRNMVVHRDLKLENLVLDSNYNVKITDFGFCNVMRDGHFLNARCGSPSYASPEHGIYNLPMSLPPGARDLIRRILVVDPTRRMTIPQICQHPWFKARLPCYLAVFPPSTNQLAKKIDEQILQKVIDKGFDKNQLIQSLLNRVQNKATVAYYLLLDHQYRNSSPYLKAEFQESGFNQIPLPRYIYYQRIDQRPEFPLERKWSLGLQFQANPHEIMTDVLKTLQELGVCWKKIGYYNMKCRWIPRIHATAMKPSNVVKFEVQLYKTREEKNLLDLQRVQGSQFLFLDLCAAIFAQLCVL